MLIIKSNYKIEDDILAIIKDNNLSISNVEIHYERSHNSNFVWNIMFSCRLYTSEKKICDFCARFKQGSQSVRIKNESYENEVILRQLNTLNYQQAGPWIPSYNEQFANIAGVVIEMIKECYFKNIFDQLKANHILTSYEDNQWSNMAFYPLDFIPRRYNSKPFSNMSPAERRKWHIKTVFNKIPVYNPEIFTLYKMRDEIK